MKYKQVTDYEIDVQKIFKDNPDEPFDVKSSNFAVFSKKTLTEEEHQGAEKNWKAHISVDPEDLEKAWDLIYPLLHENADQFKVANLSTVNEGLVRDTKTLDNIKAARDDFILQYTENKLSLGELKALAGRYSRERSEYASIENDERKLFEYVKDKLDDQVREAEEIVTETTRMAKGMQITLYMVPGKEKEHQQLLDDIEVVLIENNIKPGQIYKTDRTLGLYTSIRHPGLGEYQAAVSVKNYNPDQIPDNFSSLLSQFKSDLKEQIQIHKSVTIDEGMNDTQKSNAQARINLGVHLEEKLNKFSEKSLPEQAQGLRTFQNDCIDTMNNTDKEIKNDKEWKPLLKNLVLLLSGIGTLSAIVSLAIRAGTGRYALFDENKADAKLDQTYNSFVSPQNRINDFKQRLHEIETPIKEKEQDKTDELNVEPPHSASPQH